MAAPAPSAAVAAMAEGSSAEDKMLRTLLDEQVQRVSDQQLSYHCWRWYSAPYGAPSGSAPGKGTQPSSSWLCIPLSAAADAPAGSAQQRSGWQWDPSKGWTQTEPQLPTAQQQQLLPMAQQQKPPASAPQRPRRIGSGGRLAVIRKRSTTSRLESRLSSVLKGCWWRRLRLPA